MEDDRNYFIVMELISHGNLLDRIYQEKKFNSNMAANLMKQLLQALNFMHKTKNMMHRDLKPENLLCDVSSDGSITVKLTDFGFAKSFQEGELDSLVLGSPLYMAPELCAEELYDKKVDVWACGVIAYIFLTGKPPFIGADKDQIYKQIQFSQPDYNCPALRQNENAFDFIQKCL